MGRLFTFIHSNTFNIIWSAILGMGIVAVLKPSCKPGECVTKKAPSADEVTKAPYQIGTKCYKFSTNPVDCSGVDIIEPFRPF